MTARYVHSYGPDETQRLQDQASTLVELLHAETVYPAGAKILEAGCGVGAQTVTLASRSPKAHFTAIDTSAESLAKTRQVVAAAGLSNVTLEEADILDLRHAAGSFDAVFLCFVLEHLARPEAALLALRRVMRPGGTMTVIEDDHGSAYFHPNSPHARKTIACQVALQARAGGDALIGRRLYPMLRHSGLSFVRVSPRLVYADGSRPAMADAFTRKTFTAMIEGIRTQAIAAGLISPASAILPFAGLRRRSQPSTNPRAYSKTCSSPFVDG
jgi:SAM-dependent methyltransferase